MGDAVSPGLLVSELATLGRDLESAWNRGNDRDTFKCCELAQEIAESAETLKYALFGFGAETPGRAAAQLEGAR